MAAGGETNKKFQILPVSFMDRAFLPGGLKEESIIINWELALWRRHKIEAVRINGEYEFRYRTRNTKSITQEHKDWYRIHLTMQKSMHTLAKALGKTQDRYAFHYVEFYYEEQLCEMQVNFNFTERQQNFYNIVTNIGSSDKKNYAHLVGRFLQWFGIL